MKLLLAMDSRASNQAAIGVLDPHEGRWDNFQVVPIAEPFKRPGFRGSALVGDHLYVVNSAALYEFRVDPDTVNGPLAVPVRTTRRPEWELGERAAADLHDVHYSADRDCLLVANSRMDCVDEVSLSGELLARRHLWDLSEAVAEIAYARAPGTADLTHLNHISERAGRIYLTLGNWNGTRTGKVVRYDDGQVVLAGLEFPHDGVFHEGEFYLSNSGTSEILVYPADDGGPTECKPAVLPVYIRDDAWLGSFQWVRGIAVTRHHLIAGVTQWRKDTTDRPQLPPRLVFYDRREHACRGELFLPPVEEFPIPCIFSIHVIDDGRFTPLDYSVWQRSAPSPPPRETESEARRRVDASSLYFHAQEDRSSLSPRWSFPKGPDRTVRVLPDGSLWLEAHLSRDERFYVSTHPGPFNRPPSTNLPLSLEANQGYELSVLYTPIRGTLGVQAWVIQYSDTERLCHSVMKLGRGENRLGFAVDPRCRSACVAFRVCGDGVGWLAPLRLSGPPRVIGEVAKAGGGREKMTKPCLEQKAIDASVRRVWAAYRGETSERIPILPPIRWSPHWDIEATHFGDWRDEEGFRSLARLVQMHCDVRPPHNAVAYPRVFETLAYQRFLEAPAEYVEALPPERIGAARTRYTTLLHTPKGDLKWTYDADDGIFTTWDIQKPIGGLADVDRMLSVPYRFTPPDAAGYEPFRHHRTESRGQTLGGASLVSMVACLCGMMSFQLLLEWVIEEPGAIRDLADAWLERTGGKVDYLLSQGVGPFWHFNGVERASPPMMGPRQWEELVVPYDGEIMRRIKAHDPESRIHVHCHGRVGMLLDSFLSMGVDSIDPVEPPPQGDVTFAEARRRVGDRMTLYGNIEFLDMETKTPDEIEALVRRAIDEGGLERTVLTPSARPHERLSEVFVANARRYIEAALKYGG